VAPTINVAIDDQYDVPAAAIAPGRLRIEAQIEGLIRHQRQHY